MSNIAYQCLKYTLEEVDGVGLFLTPSAQYGFANGLGLSSIEKDSLTSEVLEKVEEHLRKFKSTEFKTSFFQALAAVGAIAPKEIAPNYSSLDYARQLKSAFAASSDGAK
jgi:hypothetical protein